MQVTGRDRFVDALVNKFPTDASVKNEVAQALAELCDTGWESRLDSVHAVGGKIFAIPDEDLLEFSKITWSGAVLHVLVGGAFGVAAVVYAIYQVVKICRNLRELSSQDRTLLVFLQLRPATAAELLNALADAGLVLAESELQHMLLRLEKLGVVGRGSASTWELTTYVPHSLAE